MPRTHILFLALQKKKKSLNSLFIGRNTTRSSSQTLVSTDLVSGTTVEPTLFHIHRSVKREQAHMSITDDSVM